MTTALDPALLNKQDWTVDDLASLPEDLHYELINGRLILPSPTLMHQYFGVEVMLALRLHCPADLIPIVDLSQRVNYRNEPRRDVVVTSLKNKRRSPLPIADTVLAIEIVSPSSANLDYEEKRQLYAAAGVGSYWVIDPAPRSAVMLTEYRLSRRGAYEQISTTDGIFTTRVPFPATIDLPAFTAFRDED
jgi:Uma2 family endonuclease